MTTDCVTNLDIAERHAGSHADRSADRGDVEISATEWGLVAILAIGFILMLPGAAFLISQLSA